ncbi:hypothetical protein [Halomonas nitroreducens]|uniref:Uncharacterized protein n=1 Tax=Halomonas nitroreducens TaxID=447425 RepID=A0A3S0R494_9GAMM|nr:hypothetical protein [Halomonas nitroreducens]RTR06950.1 hypothetical protein EKG36_00355 [Halomonas nitroreducens]
MHRSRAVGRVTGAALLALLLLAGCAGVPAWREAPSPDRERCRALLTAFDAEVAEASVDDAGRARVAGFPYLRSDRLLASFAPALRHHPDAPRYVDWLGRMRQGDAEARRIEAANLPAPARERLARHTAGKAPAVAANACGDRLLAAELLGPEDGPARSALREAVAAPDHYVDTWRVLGLYPLARVGLSLGYGRWRDAYLSGFDGPFPTRGAARRYAPAVPEGPPLDDEAAARLVRTAPRSPLGLVDLDDETLLRLAAYHAPVFAIETRGHDDRLGAPYWRRGPSGPLPAVDTNHPVADVRLAHTRFGGRVLPQLVYTVWFPARTRRGAFDILGGRLDGVVWRVTLGADGRPLIHDSIHACGCYHLFFPVSPLRRVAVPADHDLREAPLTPAYTPLRSAGQRLVVQLAAVSHYLVGLDTVDGAAGADATYALRLTRQPPRYGRRSLALPGDGRRSLFGPEGIVAGTERLERFILWPAGIRSPGAMRQWGTHATVFVGRRHFDEPFLFEGAFARPR